MKRSLILAAVAAAVSIFVNMAGFLTNLIAYHTTGNLVFYKVLPGGEWVGYYGFGILKNRTFPMTVAGDPHANGEAWLSFDPAGLFMTVLGVFVLLFVILLLVNLAVTGIRRRKANKISEGVK